MWGYQAAADEFNFDDGFDINDIDQLAPQIINGTSTVYALVGKNKDFDQQVIKWITAANSMELVINLGFYQVFQLMPYLIQGISHILQLMIPLHKLTVHPKI